MNKFIVFSATFFAFAQLSIASSLQQNSIDCSNLGLLVTSSSESNINMVFSPYSGIDILSQIWTVYSTDGDFIMTSVNESMNTYLGNNISLSDSVEVCLEVTDIYEESCEVCDTLFYNGPINEWISINSLDLLYQIDCDSLEVFIEFESENEIIMGSNATDFEGLFLYNWLITDNNGNSLSTNSNVDLSESEIDTIVSCLNTTDEYAQNCELCEVLVWDGNNWSIYIAPEEPILIVENVEHVDTTEYSESVNVLIDITNNDSEDFVDEIILNFRSYSVEEEAYSDSIYNFSVNANEIYSGESYSMSIDIAVTPQSFQYSGDNLVVIWPSTVSPVPVDTSFTLIYIREDRTSIPVFNNGISDGGEPYFDLFGREFTNWNDIPSGTVFIRKGKKYLKF